VCCSAGFGGVIVVVVIMVILLATARALALVAVVVQRSKVRRLSRPLKLGDSEEDILLMWWVYVGGLVLLYAAWTSFR
jgi:hypothetical protein